MVTKPAIGQKVRATTDFSDYLSVWMPNVPRRYTVEGTVIKGEDFDPVGSIRILTNRYHQPVSIVTLDGKTSVQILEGGEVTVVEDVPVVSAPEDGVQNYEVEGSKGDPYIVSKKGNVFTCTCIAGQHGRFCKHVKKVKADLGLAE